MRSPRHDFREKLITRGAYDSYRQEKPQSAESLFKRELRRGGEGAAGDVGARPDLGEGVVGDDLAVPEDLDEDVLRRVALGFGCVVVSETEVPTLSVSVVESGHSSNTVAPSDNAEPHLGLADRRDLLGPDERGVVRAEDAHGLERGLVVRVDDLLQRELALLRLFARVRDRVLEDLALDAVDGDRAAWYSRTTDTYLLSFYVFFKEIKKD